MTATVDVDQLPPTQYLILEVLAARVRLGEQVWSFPDRLRPQLRALSAAGLTGWKSSPEPGACLAWFTDAGRSAALLDGYESADAQRAATAEQQARAVLAAVRRIHHQYRTAWVDWDTCAGCNQGMELVAWPCPTIQAVEVARGSQ